ncbi:MAG: hypothetical protein ACKKMS_00020 [Candidatus Nealsonbacteria bacterium]
MSEPTIPKCPRCGATLVKIKDKDYYGCPKWMPYGQGCEGTIWFPEGQREKNYPNISFTHKVESKSNPGHFHIVKVYEDGNIDCPCIAGVTNKFCRHKKQTIKDLVMVLKKIKENYLKNYGGEKRKQVNTKLDADPECN